MLLRRVHRLVVGDIVKIGTDWKAVTKIESRATSEEWLLHVTHWIPIKRWPDDMMQVKDY